MHARFEKGTRYYSLYLQRDLFGWTVVRVYGRIGTPRGRIQTLPFDSEELAGTYFLAACRKREARGYVMVPGAT